tara:strand:- start:61 stop:600 length:540 start_codon:yes stop_codon:yes gene_type:complete
MSEINLKELVKQDLQAVKQKEFDLKKETNQKLKEITVYTDNSPNGKGFTDKMFEYFDNVGIKYVEKDINTYPNIRALISMSALPIIEVNGEYLVWQRDFSSYIQCETILQNIATEEFVSPPLNERMHQAIKNLSHSLNQFSRGMSQTVGGLSKQIAPMVKIMNELAEEEQEENNEKKNK